MNRRRLSLLPVLLAGLLLAAPARTEIIPDRGTFRGVFHINRAGVAQFAGYIVPPDLAEALKKYDGKYIELPILRAKQLRNPGRSVVEKIGQPKELPQPPLRADIALRNPGSAGPGTFDLIVSFRNTGKRPINLDLNNVSVGILSYHDVGEPAAQSDLVPGYTRAQMAFGGTPAQPWHFFKGLEPGSPTHFFSGVVRLGANDAVPFVFQHKHLPKGQYEVQALAHYVRPDKKHESVMGWKNLDFPLEQSKQPPPALPKAEATVTRDDEWLSVSGRLFHRGKQPPTLWTRGKPDNAFFTGVVQAFDAEGKQVPASLEWNDPRGPWERRWLDREGLNFRFRLRPEDRFEAPPIRRIALWTVTEAGAVRVEIAKDIPAPKARPLPAWGERVKGVRCRIQTPRDRFKAGEPVRVFFQAESDRSASDILWLNKGKAATQLRLEIDGQPAPISLTAISEEIIHPFPFQGQFTTGPELRLKPGKHTLRIRVTGDGTAPGNANVQPLRKFDGTMVSNEVTFEVE